MLRSLAYFVARNKNGHLGVYSDVRSNGAQCAILIKNITGSHSALAKDLTETLFTRNSPDASRMRVETKSDKVIINGARTAWTKNVLEWLQERGF
ncbi:ribosomal protein L49/IMG2 [Mycena rebaudengoi]|nr:ribosomal protein L49/IMG2 [Mycena rebaudengoi]